MGAFEPRRAEEGTARPCQDFPEGHPEKGCTLPARYRNKAKTGFWAEAFEYVVRTLT